MSAATLTPVAPSALTPDEMFTALIQRDTSLDGAFFAAIRTTGIFCRPGCGARKPRRENVEFFPTAKAAMFAGFRPCKRCRPLDPAGKPPAWVSELIAALEAHPQKRLRAADIRSLGTDPARASRYFKQHYGMTFRAYSRARRMGTALRQLRERPSMTTAPNLTRAAASAGYQSQSGFRDAFEDLFGTTPGKHDSAVVATVKWLESPLGPLLAGATDEGICLLEFIDRRALQTQIHVLRRRLGGSIVPGDHPHLNALETQLAAYFAGSLTTFTVPLVSPGTEFQAKVWNALRQIPPGETRSYADIARAIRQPTATRAVARANGDNRLAILIPCHRVIGSDGTLTGYGGGLWRKQHLLELERRSALLPFSG